jgi:hypothetical protein
MTEAVAGGLDSVDPVTLELLGMVWTNDVSYGAGAVDGFRGLLGAVYGRGLVPRSRAVWAHRRGLLALARRYGSRP